MAEARGEPSSVAEPSLHMGQLLATGSLVYSALTAGLHPLALLKTRMQAHATQLSHRSAAAEVWRVAGVRGFFKGLGPVLAGAVPARATYIVALEGTRPYALAAARRAQLSDAAASVVSGGTAGFSAVLASQVIYVPVDVVTQRLMVTDGASIGGVLRHLMHTAGPLGLYRGFTISLMTYLPGGTIWWGSYGGARSLASSAAPRAPELLAQSGCAAVAAACVVLATGPLDVVKTRVQLADASSSSGILSVARQLARAEGVRGFYRGTLPRWGHMSLWGTCVISVYETLLRRCTF